MNNVAIHNTALKRLIYREEGGEGARGARREEEEDEEDEGEGGVFGGSRKKRWRRRGPGEDNQGWLNGSDGWFECWMDESITKHLQNMRGAP